MGGLDRDIGRYIGRCIGRYIGRDSVKYRSILGRCSTDISTDAMVKCRSSIDRPVYRPISRSRPPIRYVIPKDYPHFVENPRYSSCYYIIRKYVYYIHLFFIYFSGVVSIDVELSSIDINQCDAEDPSATDSGGRNGKSDRTGSTDPMKLVDFLGTHKCKPSTQVRTKRAHFNIKGFLLVNHVMKQLTIRELEALSFRWEIKSNGLFHGGNFSEKKEYLQKYSSFLVLPDLAENDCTSCFVPLAPCFMMKYTIYA